MGELVLLQLHNTGFVAIRQRFSCFNITCVKSCGCTWMILLHHSRESKLSPTQTPNGPRKYVFKRRAAGYYNGARTSVVLVISRAGFSVMLLFYLRFFAKTWPPRFPFLRGCSQFLSVLCLLYAKILEICSNRLYTSSSLVLYHHYHAITTPPYQFSKQMISVF